MHFIKKHERHIFDKTRKRVITVTVSFGLFLCFLLYNLFALQFVNYAYYKDKVYDQITTSSALKAKRGNIYDSNMNLLASEKTTWRIFVSSREIKKREKADKKEYSKIISSGLSSILNLEYDTVLKKIGNSNVLDITLKKSANETEYESVVNFIRAENLSDMVFTEAQTSRYYPEQTMAAHVLGFVGSDLQGLYGLEYYYDDVLSGTDGYYLYGKDANGNSLPTEYANYVPPKNGHSIVTTIDSYLQRELESQLEAVRINHSVENRVCGIVMDTSSGAILAMATSSPFNPNSPYELDALSALKLESTEFANDSNEYKALKKSLLEQMWANKAVSETYEPGSTFKIVTVSAALDSGTSKVSDTFSCHGYLSVGGWNIKCHKVGGHGSGFDLGYGLQMSCNPTMMTIAERMGAKTFYDYVQRFGYFEKTGIDLPSEAGTIFHKPENIGTTELATASFGQRFKISVIRQLTSIAAVANGGVSVTPHLVDKIIDSDGKIIKEYAATSEKRVISEDVAKTVSDILEKGVSGNGGAKNAGVEGYKIAAKTGTSQKFDVLDANGNSYLRIGSTVAYSISEDSDIAMIIVVDEPTSEVKYGSVVAAPYISAFLSNALPYLNYRRDSEKTQISIENYVGKNISEVKKELSATGIEYEIIGNGNTVLKQTPTEKEEFIYSNSKIILYTSPDSELYSIVPDVLGLDSAEANKKIVNSGLNVRITRLGATSAKGAKVISQSIPYGTVVQKNTVVELEILYTDFED